MSDNHRHFLERRFAPRSAAATRFALSRVEWGATLKLLLPLFFVSFAAPWLSPSSPPSRYRARGVASGCAAPSSPSFAWGPRPKLVALGGPPPPPRAPGSLRSPPRQAPSGVASLRESGIVAFGHAVFFGWRFDENQKFLIKEGSPFFFRSRPPRKKRRIPPLL